MRLIGKPKLLKFQKKSIGNTALVKAINELIEELQKGQWENGEALSAARPDADLVHNDGFYFFNLRLHRTLVLIEFLEQEATVVWIGSHKEYETLFKNNKNTIARWLRANDYIL